MNNDGELQWYVSAIVSYAPPQKVLLFGSRAGESAGHESDFDLCVIYDRLPKRKLELMQDLYKSFFSFTGHPVDLVVYQADQFSERAAQQGTFEATIAAEGRTVYG